MAKKKAKEEVAPSVEQTPVASNKEEVIEEGSAIVEQNEQMKQELEPVLHTEPIIQEEVKPKLHVLADDRLNSLIAKANEQGITDVVQILCVEKYGQFYLVYRE